MQNSLVKFVSLWLTGMIDGSVTDMSFQHLGKRVKKKP